MKGPPLITVHDGDVSLADARTLRDLSSSAEERGLADARFTDNVKRPATTGLEVGDRPLDHCELGSPPDEHRVVQGTFACLFHWGARLDLTQRVMRLIRSLSFVAGYVSASAMAFS
jgi:hypothetical protein